MITPRQLVLEAINAERARGDAKYGAIPVADCGLRDYTELVHDKIDNARFANDRNAIRKRLLQTANLCIKALEQCGLPEPEQSKQSFTVPPGSKVHVTSDERMPLAVIGQGETATTIPAEL